MANDWGIREWALIIGPLLSFAVSMVFMWVKDSYQRGTRDEKANNLAKEVSEFKHEIKEAIKLLFEKMDRVAENIGKYPCQQLGMLASHETQIRANTARLDRVQIQIQELERAMLNQSPPE